MLMYSRWCSACFPIAKLHLFSPELISSTLCRVEELIHPQPPMELVQEVRDANDVFDQEIGRYDAKVRWRFARS